MGTFEKLNLSRHKFLPYLVLTCLISFFLCLTWKQSVSATDADSSHVSLVKTEKQLEEEQKQLKLLQVTYGDRTITLNHEPQEDGLFEDEAGVTVPTSALFHRDELQFPLRYTLSGNGDLGWAALSERFYGTAMHAHRLQYENAGLTETELVPGVEVTIPDPKSSYAPATYAEVAQVQKTADQDVLLPNGTIQATAEELDLFARVLATESGPNWDYKGIRMIAESITNRVRNYHKSLYSILFQADQYTVVYTGAYLNANVRDIHRSIAQETLKGNIYLPANVEFFCTTEAYQRVTWFQTLKTFEIYDNTVFMSTN